MGSLGSPSCLEVGGNPTILLNHSGVRANQLRYNDGTLYLEAVTNGWHPTTTPNLTVGGTVTAGAINGCVTAPLVITGTGQNHNNGNDLSVVKIGGKSVVSTMARGLTLVVLNRATYAVESNTTYDTWSAESNAAALLATALNGLTNKIGILVSCDAWETNVTTGLKNAFQRLGLTKASNVANTDLRRPYAAIFEANEVANASTSKAIHF